jgi:hypothetical protein
LARDDHTTVIQNCIDRLRAGDETARAALLSGAGVNSRWLAARVRLSDSLGGHLPI